MKYAIVDPVMRDQKRREWNPQADVADRRRCSALSRSARYAVRWNRKRSV